MRSAAFLLALFVTFPFSFWQRQESTSTPIIPKTIEACFSKDSGGKPWSGFIDHTTGEKAYILSLEPEYDVNKRLLGVELTLRHAGQPNNAPNLLNPTGNWHGLQAFDFNADDLVNGVSKSAFGARRAIPLEAIHIVLEVTILNAKVERAKNGIREINELKLSVAVKNLLS